MPLKQVLFAESEIFKIPGFNLIINIKLEKVAVHVKNNRIQFYNNCEMSGGNFIQYQRNMPDNTKMQMAKTIDMEGIPILWTFIIS